MRTHEKRFDIPSKIACYLFQITIIYLIRIRNQICIEKSTIAISTQCATETRTVTSKKSVLSTRKMKYDIVSMKENSVASHPFCLSPFPK